MKQVFGMSNHMEREQDNKCKQKIMIRENTVDITQNIKMTNICITVH